MSKSNYEWHLRKFMFGQKHFPHFDSCSYILFWKKTQNFYIWYFTLRKQTLTPENSAKICNTPGWDKSQGQKQRPIEIPQVFHEHPWKFNFLFNWPLEFPYALTLISMGNLCSQPPCHQFGFFFGIAHCSV